MITTGKFKYFVIDTALLWLMVLSYGAAFLSCVGVMAVVLYVVLELDFWLLGFIPAFTLIGILTVKFARWLDRLR